MSRYLILGGGISGCTAGFELARLGHDVTILEQANRFGGKVLDYCCKATDACSRCGVCVAASQLHGAAKQAGVHIHTGAALRQIRRNGTFTAQAVRSNPYVDPGLCVDCEACLKACPVKAITRVKKAELVQYSVDFAKCRLHHGKACDLCVKACSAGAVTAGSPESTLNLAADGVLLATGHLPYDAARKIRMGYGRFPGVLTGVEAEEILGRQESLGNPGDSVAFVQCVGSRDPVEGRNYCSAVCCAYALRLARILKHRSPQANISIYYIDLQNFDKNFTRLREELTAAGVRFIRGVPFRVEQVSSGKLELFIENPDGPETVAEHDHVVLSVGLGPEPATAPLADWLAAPRNEFGFIASGAPAPRVWATGTCVEPQSIPDSMASARAVALEMSLQPAKTAARPAARGQAAKPAARSRRHS